MLHNDIPADKFVRMTPEQLASAELAKWREREAKHVSPLQYLFKTAMGALQIFALMSTPHCLCSRIIFST